MASHASTGIIPAFPGGGVRLDLPMNATALPHGESALALRARCSERLGWDLESALASGDVGTHPGRAQPATFAVWLGSYLDATATGLQTAAILGHSAGDWTAAAAAGVIAVEDVIDLLVLRGALIEQHLGLSAGTMAMLVGPSPAEVHAFLRKWPGVWIAAENGRRSCTLSLRTEVVQRFVDAVGDSGFGELRLLAIPFPSHTPLMAPVANGLREAMRSIELRPPEVPLISSTSALYLSVPSVIGNGLAQNVTGKVRWWAAVEKARALFDGSFIDLLPGAGMTSLFREAGVPRSQLLQLEPATGLASIRAL